MEELLDAAAEAGRRERTDLPLALLAPHAGYVYSGATAARAYAGVCGMAVDRVLLMGPSHYDAFTGGALPAEGYFRTPLGDVTVDREATDYEIRSDAHAPEHSLEVQLPFLQVALAGAFEIVPVLLGRLPAERVGPLADPLDELLRRWDAAGLSWLIVASSDAYHGHEAEALAANDARLRELFERLDGAGLVKASLAREVMACGWLPVALTIELARRHGASRASVAGQSNSRAVTGEQEGYVVGYLSGWIEGAP